MLPGCGIGVAVGSTGAGVSVGGSGISRYNNFIVTYSYLAIFFFSTSGLCCATNKNCIC